MGQENWRKRRPRKNRGEKIVRSIRAGALVLAFIVGLAQVAYAAPQPSEWIDAWGASPQPAVVGLPFAPDAKPFADQTLREIIHPEAGGSRARVRLSNTFGDRPLTIGSAKVARRSTGPAVDAGSVHGLTFGGQQGITVPVGAEVLSDPVDMRVVPDADLAVDIYLPQNTGAVTEHFDARQTSYVAAGTRPGRPTWRRPAPSPVGFSSAGLRWSRTGRPRPLSHSVTPSPMARIPLWIATTAGQTTWPTGSDMLDIPW